MFASFVALVSAIASGSAGCAFACRARVVPLPRLSSLPGAPAPVVVLLVGARRFAVARGLAAAASRAGVACVAFGGPSLRLVLAPSPAAISALPCVPAFRRRARAFARRRLAQICCSS